MLVCVILFEWCDFECFCFVCGLIVGYTFRVLCFDWSGVFLGKVVAGEFVRACLAVCWFVCALLGWLVGLQLGLLFDVAGCLLACCLLFVCFR